jgi:hypothetical protein
LKSLKYKCHSERSEESLIQGIIKHSSFPVGANGRSPLPFSLIYYFRLILITIIPLIFISCNLFSTRNPEKPDTNRGTFVTPTSPDIVISNLINAFKEKNTENYISCLSDTTKTDTKPFTFIPSSDANANYSLLFKNWSLQNERRFFYSMVLNLPDNSKPVINLTNSKFEVLLLDSAVYVSNYYLEINHNQQGTPKKFSGVLQFTLFHRTNGLWSIQKWLDLNNPNDTIGATWSILKASFNN